MKIRKYDILKFEEEPVAATVRNKGQVTIPAEIRKAVHLEVGDLIEFEVVSEGILLKPRKVIDSTQAWFWAPEWQAGEREAVAELAGGRGRVFDSPDDFLASFDD